MSHRNARTTFHGRRLIVERFADGWPKAHIAAAMGISRKCVGTWIARHDAEGEAGLRDRSSRPHTMPTRTPDAVEDQIVALRRVQRRGPEAISAELGVTARTVSRVLRRRNVPYLRDCDPMTGELIRASKTTAVRYERERSGELVHMDVKKLGRIPDGGGWRALGRDKIARSPKAGRGFDYVHSLVDDHSRLAYSEILADEKGPTCAAFLRRAAGYFRDHGINRIERVIESTTPNGRPFTGRKFTNHEVYWSGYRQRELRRGKAKIEGIVHYVRMRRDSTRAQLKELRKTMPCATDSREFPATMEPLPR